MPSRMTGPRRRDRRRPVLEPCEPRVPLAVIVDLDTGLVGPPPPGVNASLVPYDFATQTPGVPAAANAHGSLMLSIFTDAERTLGRHDAWLSLKVSDATGTFMPDAIARAMTFVATTVRQQFPAEAIVVNCSLAGPTSPIGGLLIQQAEAQLAAAGIVVSAAAGNDGANTDLAEYWPAAGAGYPSSPNVLAVAVADDAGALRRYSNYGVHTTQVAARNLFGTSGAAVLGSIALASEADLDPQGWRGGAAYARAVVAATVDSAAPSPALAGWVASGGELLDLSPRLPYAVPAAAAAHPVPPTPALLGALGPRRARPPRVLHAPRRPHVPYRAAFRAARRLPAS